MPQEGDYEQQEGLGEEGHDMMGGHEHEGGAMESADDQGLGEHARGVRVVFMGVCVEGAPHVT
jgi:hypothetical protein